MHIEPTRRIVSKRFLCISVAGIIFALLAFWLSSYVSQRRAFAERTHCVGNLIQIRIAKSLYVQDMHLVDGSPIPPNALNTYLSAPPSQYRCSSGGSYIIGSVGVTPTCTYTNPCYTCKFNVAKCRLERTKCTHSLEPNEPH